MSKKPAPNPDPLFHRLRRIYAETKQAERAAKKARREARVLEIAREVATAQRGPLIPYVTAGERESAARGLIESGKKRPKLNKLDNK